jgi:murein DD-endopeptidase MepM/ murein hydrolase activator NlpD
MSALIRYKGHKGRLLIAFEWTLAVHLASAASIAVDVRARAIQPGELVVLTIAVPAPVDRVDIVAFGHPVAVFKVDDSTWRALVGIDLAVKAGSYEISIDAHRDGWRATKRLDVRPHRFPTRALSVDSDFVNPPPETQIRIEREARELQAVWRTSARDRLWSGPFVRPVPGEANGRFGTRSVFNGQRRAPHGGADFLSAAGTPIHAPNAGRVVVARPLYFTGNTVVIDHGLGVFSLLAHLSIVDVKEGDVISADQVVGQVGSTGRVTGPHLHWAVRINDARVDPLSVLALVR